MSLPTARGQSCSIHFFTCLIPGAIEIGDLPIWTWDTYSRPTLYLLIVFRGETMHFPPLDFDGGCSFKQ